MSNNTNTLYVVRNNCGRTFLSRPAYSGRVRGLWDTFDGAHIFRDKRQAQSCASNINHRRPDGDSSYYAEVRELTFTTSPLGGR
jgi:hypothetical protein